MRPTGVQVVPLSSEKESQMLLEPRFDLSPAVQLLCDVQLRRV